MMWLAGVIREHRALLGASLWGRFGVRISDIGWHVPWGDAIDFAVDVMSDQTTRIGAHLAEWDYVATMPEMVMIAAIGAKKALPFDPDQGGRAKQKVTPEEAAAAQQVLEEQILFT